VDVVHAQGETRQQEPAEDRLAGEGRRREGGERVLRAAPRLEEPSRGE